MLKFVGRPDSKGNISLVCPYHDDHSPSASYNIELGLFHCFTCGESSNKARLEAEFGEIDTSITAGFIYKPIEWEEQYMIASRKVSDYAASRLITQDMAEEYGMRFTTNSVIFPVTNNIGQIIGIQVRRVDMTPKYLTLIDSEKPMLTPMHMWNPEDDFFVTEGIFGMLRMRQAGYNAFTSMGAVVKRKYMNILKMYGHKFAVLFDPDKAGIKGMLSVGYATGCKVHMGGVEIDNVPLEYVHIHANNIGRVEDLASYIVD